MSILPHSEKDHVEHWPATSIGRDDSADFGAGQFGGFGRDLFATNSMHLFVRNFGRLQQFFKCEPIVALFMFGWNASFVRPKEMNRPKAKSAGFLPLGNSAKKI